MLAEFKYGGVPKETFAPILGSQDKPSSLFYWLKKDFFPTVYWNAFVKVGHFVPLLSAPLLIELELIFELSDYRGPGSDREACFVRLPTNCTMVQHSARCLRAPVPEIAHWYPSRSSILVLLPC